MKYKVKKLEKLAQRGNKMENDERINKKVTIVVNKQDKMKLDIFLAVLVDVAEDMGILATITDVNG